MIIEAGSFTTGSTSTDIFILNNIVNNLYLVQFTVGKTQSAVNSCTGTDNLTIAQSTSSYGSTRQNVDNTKSIKLINSSGTTILAGEITNFDTGDVTVTWSTAQSGWKVQYTAFGD